MAENPFSELDTAATPPPPTTFHGSPTSDEQHPSRPDRTSTQSPRQRESPVDSRVAALRAMFPDYDDAILQPVLESVDWDPDRAIDALLTMGDPDYKPEPQRQTHRGPMTQEELDEQFAHQLVMQEQEQHSQWQAAQPHGPQGDYNYAPRRSQPQGWTPPPQQGSAQQGPGMAEIQEQISKFAETGKKTFGNILSKLKAKVQEFEQGRPAGSPSSPPAQSAQWAPGPASYYGPPQTGTQSQTSYYNPNRTMSPTNSPSPPQPPAPVVNWSERPASPPDWAPTQPSAPNQARSTSPPATGPSPGSTAQPIENSKLKLPPKQQPISLMALQDTHSIDSASTTDSPTIPAAQPAAVDKASISTPAAHKGYSVDDEDDLEYAENPFEDSRK